MRFADQFNCVPSQINYVINTRFTIQQGYVVESKRGGGGYIRIMKSPNLVDEMDVLKHFRRTCSRTTFSTRRQLIYYKTYMKMS